MLFDFVFNPFALLSLLAVAINTTLLYLIISKGLQVSANRWFAFLLISLIAWGCSEFLSRSSSTAAASEFWSVFGMIGWAFIGPIFLGFTLSYVNRDEFLSNLWNQLLLFVPGFIFLFLGWATNLINNRDISTFHKVYYGWNSPSAPLFWLLLAWLDGLLLLSVVILVNYLLKSSDKKEKQRTIWIIVAVLIPIVGGSITNGIFPILNIQIFPAAILLTSVMSLIITYAILRYQLFAINPAGVVSNIVQTMHEILVVFSPDGFIEFVNPAVEKILGYSKPEIIGKQVKILFEEAWGDFDTKVVKQVLKENSVSGIEFDLVSKTGEKVPVTFSASVLKDSYGKVFGIVAVASDIRKIRDLFIDVSAERNKLTTTLDSIVDGVLALDFEGNVTMANPAGLAMISSKDVVGKKLEEVLTLFDGGQTIVPSDLMAKTKIDHDTIIFQKPNVKIVTKSGKQVFVNLTSSAIKEGKEAGLGAIITMTDISKEKEFEEMKIDFVSMAAHELRTPLTAIRGYLSVLQEETSSALSKEQNSFLEKAFISSSQLAALVENLLSVSKIERGAMKLEADQVDWKEVLNEAFGNFKPLADERRMKLKINLPKQLEKAFVDKFRISEVISNLVANAINYTKPGGTVEISAKSDGKEITTMVRDTGQGIPQAAIQKLFTKFFRVSGVLEQGSKGTGLGLYISKAIVDMHKGKIWVESKLGEGTTFYFTVPTIKTRSKLEKELTKENSRIEAEILKEEPKTPAFQASANFPKIGKRFFKRKP